jgi:hypothetical protein
MTRSLISALCWGTFVAGLLELAAGPVSAQVPQPSRQAPFAYQSHVFRRILFDLKLQPLKDYDELYKHAADTILIVLGDTKPLRHLLAVRSLSQFVDRGGAVLIATDRRIDTLAEADVAEALGMVVSGQSFASVDGREVYHNAPFCPYLVGDPELVPDLLRGPSLGAGNRLRVATNAPSCLWDVGGGRPQGVHRLAWLPRSVRAEGPAHLFHGGLPGGATGERPLFAVGREIGDGRILLLADHSIFINQMMLPEDNNNVEFTSNCLAYLRGEGGQRPRGHVLLIEEGVIRTDLEVPLKELPDLPPGAERIIVAKAEEVLTKLQEENAFNKGLESLLTGNDPRRTRLVLRVLLATGTLLLFLYLAYRIGVRSRVKLDAHVPLLACAAAKEAPSKALLQQRRTQAITGGNLWETAHGLARQWAQALPISAESAALPRLELRGSWWRCWALRRRFGKVWRLAQSSTSQAVSVSPQGLRQLIADLSFLETARADGSLVLPDSEARR